MENNKSNPTTNTLFYSGPSSTSSRIIYTPSPFAHSLLYLQECGELTAIRPHVSGRDGLSSYLMFVVKEGNGWVEYCGKRYELCEGDCCFISCKDGYKQSSSETCWRISWCHFNSSNMPAIWNKYCERGGRPTFHPSDPTVYISLLDRLYETASSESYIRDVEINTVLSELIGLLFTETVWKETVYEEHEHPVPISTGSTTSIDVSQIKTYIDTHYKDQLTLESLAERFYFSKHYLARAFKETFGMSVGSYIQIVRVGRAKELLRFSSLSIEEIGCEAGYEESNYFARVFKKVEGCSPSSYRQSWMSRREEK